MYEIVNVLNGKRYVGSSVNISDRCYEHKRLLKHGTHHSQKLQNAWDKHGGTAFEFKPVLICGSTKEQLILYELLCFVALKPAYNIAPFPNSTLGVKHSPEVRAANSLRQRGRKNSPDAIARTAEKNRGKKRTPEFCARISALMRGRKASPETRLKISAVQQGRRCSPESIAKRAAANRGKHRTAEQCARIGAGNRGKTHAPLSAERRQYLSLVLTGCKLGPMPLSQRVALSTAHKGKPWSPARRAAYTHQAQQC